MITLSLYVLTVIYILWQSFPKMMAIVANSLIVLSVLCSSVLGETGCPDWMEIAPCKCRDLPTTVLVCRNMESLLQLTLIAENARRYTFQEVHIESTSISHLPHDLFDGIDVKELYLKDVFISTLFDSPPEKLQTLNKLHLDNTVIFRNLVWKLLNPLKSLREISINNMHIKIGAKLGHNLPENVAQLTFYNTSISQIRPGTLKGLEDLDKFAVESSKIKTLSRDIFPSPFNGRILSFNDNRISNISEDLFTDMPNLQSLSMKNNNISRIPESAFAGRTQNIPYFKFEGNPLICDCKLKWILEDKPEFLGGTCTSPELLYGKNLKDLNPADIKC